MTKAIKGERYRAAECVSDYARQTIFTRYAGPTDRTGARVIVKAEAGRMSVAWDHSLDSFENHARAAMKFADKFAWSGEWVPGGTADGYVFCMVPSPG